MYKIAGVTKAVYIPVDMEDEVRKWNRQYKKLKNIIAEISRTSKSIIARHVTEKKLKKGKK
jgi:hypothetical protein